MSRIPVRETRILSRNDRDFATLFILTMSGESLWFQLSPDQVLAVVESGANARRVLDQRLTARMDGSENQ